VDGFLILILFKVVLEIGVKVVLNGIDSGIDLPCGLGVLGVVSVLTAEESKDSPGLHEVLSIFGLEQGDLTELELTRGLEFLKLLSVNQHVLIFNLSMRKEHSDGLSTSVDIKVVKLHIFFVSFI
jgi:hypothetical protein